MPSDKKGALMLVAKDKKVWTEVCEGLEQPTRLFKRELLPKERSKRSRFLAWSAGMPPHAVALEKRCVIRPEDLWFDGALLHYTERDTKYRWIAQKPGKEDENDNDENCGCSGRNCGGPHCCAECSKRCLAWQAQGYDGAWYFKDGAGHWYDCWGNPITNSEHSKGGRYSLPPQETGGDHWRRGSRMGQRSKKPASPIISEAGSAYVKRDSATGRSVRLSNRPRIKVYDEGGSAKTTDVRSFRQDDD